MTHHQGTDPLARQADQPRRRFHKPWFYGLLAVAVIVGFTVAYVRLLPPAPEYGESGSAPAAASTDAGGHQELLRMSGTSDQNSPPFDVTTPWTIHYDRTCGTSVGTFAIWVYDSGNNIVQLAANTAESGASVTNVYETGRGMHLNVTALNCTWSLTVTQ